MDALLATPTGPLSLWNLLARVGGTLAFGVVATAMFLGIVYGATWVMDMERAARGLMPIWSPRCVEDSYRAEMAKEIDTHKERTLTGRFE